MNRSEAIDLVKMVLVELALIKRSIDEAIRRCEAECG
jgi:hypothetical protein